MIYFCLVGQITCSQADGSVTYKKGNVNCLPTSHSLDSISGWAMHLGYS